MLTAISILSLLSEHEEVQLHQFAQGKAQALSVTMLIISLSFLNSKSNLHFIGGVHMAYTSHIEQIFADLAFERHLAKLAEAKAKYDALKKAKEAK